MTANLKLVETIYESNASNIAQMLRDSATSIESETDDDARTLSMVAVQLCEGNRVKVYGWGKTDSVAAIGTLQLGVAELTRQVLGITVDD